jgi:4-diphosphocytidyl-2C-methyl-D-erythritol kinase
MAPATEKSFTRVTLALDIIGTIGQGRYKGFHELSTIKHQIGLYDTITVEDSETTQIRCPHPSVPLDNTNICWKALDAVKNARHIDKNVIITIEKNIPVFGGLAGGSANGASTLKLLNKLWDLKLGTKQLIDLGRNVGMDVPYYFIGNTAFDSESTGILEPIKTELYFDFIVVLPDFGVSTREAYGNIDYSLIAKNTEKTSHLKNALAKNDRAGVINNIHNDFELSVFKRFPELERIKKKLLNLGCANAVMSGSGSTIIGILNQSTEGKKISKEIGYTSLIVSSKKSSA